MRFYCKELSFSCASFFLHYPGLAKIRHASWLKKKSSADADRYIKLTEGVLITEPDQVFRTSAEELVSRHWTVEFTQHSLQELLKCSDTKQLTLRMTRIPWLVLPDGDSYILRTLDYAKVLGFTKDMRFYDIGAKAPAVLSREDIIASDWVVFPFGDFLKNPGCTFTLEHKNTVLHLHENWFQYFQTYDDIVEFI
jgi:hypothetical protein